MIGRALDTVAELDQLLNDTDGNSDNSSLGANAIVGVSMAAWCAQTSSAGVPALAGPDPGRRIAMPTGPHFNVVNVGAHAPNSLNFQEFMLAPRAHLRSPKQSVPEGRSMRPRRVCGAALTSKSPTSRAA